MINRRFVLYITALLIVSSAVTQAEEQNTNIVQQLEKTPASVMDIVRLRLDLYLSQSIQDIKASSPIKNIELYEAKSYITDNKELYLVSRAKTAARFLNLEQCTDAIETFQSKLSIGGKLWLTLEGVISEREIGEITRSIYLLLILEEATNSNLQVQCVLKPGATEAVEYK